MRDTNSTDASVLNRRFIRLQAVFHLYAFYLSKQANYDWALDQIHDDLVPDDFGDTEEPMHPETWGSPFDEVESDAAFEYGD